MIGDPADERPAEADPSRQMAHPVERVGRGSLEVVVLLRMFTPNKTPKRRWDHSAAVSGIVVFGAGETRVVERHHASPDVSGRDC